MTTGMRRDQMRGFEQRPIATSDIVNGTIVVGDFNASVYGGTPTSIDPDDAGAAGAATTISRSDHQHQATTGTPASVGTANAEGSGTGFARDDHVHDIANGAIDAAALIADGVITAAKINHEAWTSTTPTFTNVTLGTGGTSSMHHIQIGRTVHFRAGFTLGTGTGDVTGTITLTLPVASSAGRRFLGNAAATDASALGATFPGVALITATTLTVFATSLWGTTSPMDWTASDEFTVDGTYESAT